MPTNPKEIVSSARSVIPLVYTTRQSSGVVERSGLHDLCVDTAKPATVRGTVAECVRTAWPGKPTADSSPSILDQNLGGLLQIPYRILNAQHGRRNLCF